MKALMGLERTCDGRRIACQRASVVGPRAQARVVRGAV